MGSKHCRLYDENLVHNIMLSTGLSIMEFLKKNKNAGYDEVCEFVELNSHVIIEDTIEQLNSAEEESDKQLGTEETEDGWPFVDPEEK
jgi:hypothetical protein